MGLEFVEFVLALEKRFHRRIDMSSFSDGMRERKERDASLGDFLDYVNESSILVCGSCDYDLRGLGEQGRCPECGKPFQVTPILWDEFRQVVVKEFRVESAQLRRETMLRADLLVD